MNFKEEPNMFSSTPKLHSQRKILLSTKGDATWTQPQGGSTVIGLQNSVRRMTGLCPSDLTNASTYKCIRNLLSRADIKDPSESSTSQPFQVPSSACNVSGALDTVSMQSTCHYNKSGMEYAAMEPRLENDCAPYFVTTPQSPGFINTINTKYNSTIIQGLEKYVTDICSSSSKGSCIINNTKASHHPQELCSDRVADYSQNRVNAGARCGKSGTAINNESYCLPTHSTSSPPKNYKEQYSMTVPKLDKDPPPICNIALEKSSFVPQCVNTRDVNLTSKFTPINECFLPKNSQNTTTIPKLENDPARVRIMESRSAGFINSNSENGGQVNSGSSHIERPVNSSNILSSGILYRQMNGWVNFADNSRSADLSNSLSSSSMAESNKGHGNSISNYTHVPSSSLASERHYNATLGTQNTTVESKLGNSAAPLTLQNCGFINTLNIKDVYTDPNIEPVSNDILPESEIIPNIGFGYRNHYKPSCVSNASKMPILTTVDGNTGLYCTPAVDENDSFASGYDFHADTEGNNSSQDSNFSLGYVNTTNNSKMATAVNIKDIKEMNFQDAKVVSTPMDPNVAVKLAPTEKCNERLIVNANIINDNRSERRKDTKIHTPKLATTVNINDIKKMNVMDAKVVCTPVDPNVKVVKLASTQNCNARFNVKITNSKTLKRRETSKRYFQKTSHSESPILDSETSDNEDTLNENDFQRAIRKSGSSVSIEEVEKCIIKVDYKKKGKYHCDYCQNVYGSWHTLQNHVAFTHTRNVGRYKCDACGVTFMYKSKLKSHYYQHSGRLPFQCSLCDKKYVTPDRVRWHILISHFAIKLYRCKICNKKFCSKFGLRIHAKTHSIARFLCDICGKACPDQDKLEMHVATHGEKSIKCQDCGSAFHCMLNLKKHMRSLHGEKSVLCEVCGKFMTPLLFKRHIHVHNIPVYKCSDCGKSFKTKGCLAQHSMIHTGEKLRCNECGFGFSQLGALNRHKVTVHGGTKPFECDICGKTFTQTNSLTRHKRIHSGERPFACEVCGKRFIERYRLTVHMKQHEEVIESKS